MLLANGGEIRTLFYSVAPAVRSFESTMSKTLLVSREKSFEQKETIGVDLSETRDSTAASDVARMIDKEVFSARPSGED